MCICVMCLAVVGLIRHSVFIGLVSSDSFRIFLFVCCSCSFLVVLFLFIYCYSVIIVTLFIVFSLCLQ